MSPRRTLIIIVAIVIAAVAAVANVLYLNGVQDRANNHAKLLRVFVVAHDIPKGATGEDAIGKGFVTSGSIPSRFRPATALTDVNAIRGKVALTALASGQVLVDGQFVEPRTAQVTFSQRIPAGQVAVSVNFDAVHSVDNLLVPGDKVDMVVTLVGKAPAGGVASTTATEQMLFQNVNIIAIGSTAAPQAGETTTVANPGSGAITFAVPPVAAEKIILASTTAININGGGGGGGGGGGAGNAIYLLLVPPDNQPTPIPPVDGTNVLAGGLTPYQ